MEIITGVERRRRWRDEDKLRVLAPIRGGLVERAFEALKRNYGSPGERHASTVRLPTAKPARQRRFWAGATAFSRRHAQHQVYSKCPIG